MYTGLRSYTPGTAGYVPSIFPSQKKPKLRSTATSSRAGNSALANHQPMKHKLKITKVDHPDNDSKATWTTTDHDYLHTKMDPTQHQPEHIQLQQRILHLEEENKALKKRVLSLDQVKDNDKEFQFWTNLPNFAVFESLAKYLEERCGGELRYWYGLATNQQAQHYSSTMKRKPGKTRLTSFREEFFLTLVKLKTGKQHKDLAFSFGVSESYVSRLITTWINFLCVELRNLFEMKANTEDVDNLPDCSKDMLSLLVVLDCTELVSCHIKSNSFQRTQESGWQLSFGIFPDRKGKLATVMLEGFSVV